MKSNHVRKNQKAIFAAASAASLAVVSGAHAQTVQSGQISISVAGSTALKNWLVAKTNTFTEIQPYSASEPGSGTLNINGQTYPPASDGGLTYWANDGGEGQSFQLAPSNNTTNLAGGTHDSDAAIQFTYHESGSVEGVLELANDQIYTNSNYAPSTGIASTSIPYVTANVDRNPDSGNAVWLNYNQIGSSGTTSGAAYNATTGSNLGNGLTLGNFYAPGVGQTGTSGVNTVWTSGSASNPTPTFNQAGANANGGQNAVQIAMSDAVPQQVFVNNYGNTSNTFTPQGSTSSVTVTGTANTSFNSNPLDLGYGSGNTAIPSVGAPGTAGIRAAYQSPSVLNMPANAQNPRAAQGTTFGVGPWNNAADGGLGNLNSQLTAVTATAFVANPGTGLTQVDRTDANWLEMTGRLANGASFNMTTRDVNSGTRDVSALDTGVDPTYAVGKDDEGNGTLSNAANNAVFDQTSIGPTMRFSNKTAGGAQLRPTVQNNRMAVGTLSINDAGGNDEQGNANPVRVLNYSDSVNGSAPYVSPNYATISNGTYVIYQNEQVVTFQAPNAATYSTTLNGGVTTASNGAEILTAPVQGDDSSGDVVTLLNNTANSVATAASASSPANPADGLLDEGYIIPSLMQVTKNFNGEGLNNSVPGTIATGQIESQTNPNFNSSLYGSYAANVGPVVLPDLTTQEPTTGTGSTYGGKGSTFSKTYINSPGNAAIPITNNNYLFGNFNQNGLRDYDAAVVSALSADRALISADQAVGASVPGSEFTSQGDNNGVAGGTNGVSNTAAITYTATTVSGSNSVTLTKGDLIVMGDYTGDGHFDGGDLVAMAEGASLTNISNTNGAPDYRTGTLMKNTAMNYLNSTVGTTGADAYIRKSGAAILTAPSVPSGATPILNPITNAQLTDPVTGYDEFTYDPTGALTFDPADVLREGTVDVNDAVAVDNANGLDYTNIGNQVGATVQAPITGQIGPFNLVMAKQSDGSTVINSSDVAAINSQLTGTGTSNWYGYTLNKTGPNTIDYARTGGTINVYSGAGFNVAGGEFEISGTQDPFSDNNAGGPTAGNHVALSVSNGASVIYANGVGTSTVSALNIDLASNSTLNLNNNTLFIDYGSGPDPVTSIQSYLASGFNGGSWNGPGIISTDAQTPTNGLDYALGFADYATEPVTGFVAGLSSGQIEVKYTLVGDLNLNGFVDGVDFSVLGHNFNKFDTNWTDGNMLYHSLINGQDFSVFAKNFGRTAVGGSITLSAADWAAFDAFEANEGVAVPEPASASLLLLGGIGVLARRRRRVTR